MELLKKYWAKGLQGKEDKNIPCVMIVSHLFKAQDTILLKVLLNYRLLLKNRLFLLHSISIPNKSHNILVPESSPFPK